ncbi:MAG: hypothetical protein AAGD07_07885 [Planctomycetota bacterium]
MTNHFTAILISQYEAALSTVDRCVGICDEGTWRRSLAELTYAQAAFHALFFTDLYLHPTHDASFKEQGFHLRHRDAFRDYEELEERRQVHHYEQSFVRAYVRHCLGKARDLAGATEDWLREPAPFPWIPTTRSELHLYNIRHLQHHAAQLILVLRQNGPVEFPWYKTGWQPFPAMTEDPRK